MRVAIALALALLVAGPVFPVDTWVFICDEFVQPVKSAACPDNDDGEKSVCLYSEKGTTTDVQCAQGRWVLFGSVDEVSCDTDKCTVTERVATP